MRRVIVGLFAAALIGGGPVQAAQAARQAEHFGNCGKESFTVTYNSKTVNAAGIDCPDHPASGPATGGRQTNPSGNCGSFSDHANLNSRNNVSFFHDCPD